jgi:hypothetical protein
LEKFLIQHQEAHTIIKNPEKPKETTHKDKIMFIPRQFVFHFLAQFFFLAARANIWQTRNMFH